MIDKINWINTAIQHNTLVKLSEVESNHSVQNNMPYQNQQTDYTINFWNTINSVGSFDTISRLFLKYSEVYR